MLYSFRKTYLDGRFHCETRSARDLSQNAQVSNYMDFDIDGNREHHLA
jgi:hypothetical protein